MPTADSQRQRERSHLCESHEEEVANSITHGIGIPLSIAGLIVLVVQSTRYGDAWHITGTAIFGSTLVLLYLASCLYHSMTRPFSKRVFQVLDHACIFLLIAGSYTPFLLVNLRGPWGWALFGVVWGLALGGIVVKAILLPRFERSTSAVYVVMGWLIVVAGRQLIESLPPKALFFLVAGGVSYTLGVVFFLWERLRFAHAIWHLFVLAGSILHFFAVYYGVIPREA